MTSVSRDSVWTVTCSPMRHCTPAQAVLASEVCRMFRQQRLSLSSGSFGSVSVYGEVV